MSISKIWVKNYIDSVLSTATVKLSDPTGTFGIKDSTDSVVVADGTAVSEVSTGVFEYGSAGSPLSDESWFDSTETYTYVFEITQTSGDVDYVQGTFGPASGRPEFSEAYGAVRSNLGSIITATVAKRLVNESLRVVANDDDWDWRNDDDPESFTTVSGTSQYNLSNNVDQIIGAYNSQYQDIPIVDALNFSILDLADRESGGPPQRLLVIGDNVVMPDPLPDDAYTVYILYKKLFELSADSDEFPCKQDFVDAIVARATWLGAEIIGKQGLAQSFRNQYQEMLMHLRRSRVRRGHLTFGDPGYSFLPAKKRRYW